MTTIVFRLLVTVTGDLLREQPVAYSVNEEFYWRTVDGVDYGVCKQSERDISVLDNHHMYCLIYVCVSIHLNYMTVCYVYIESE